jgi:hypothetical protein
MGAGVPTGRSWLLSPAGALFCAELRRERRKTSPEQCVLLPCADGLVRLPRLVAHILSPVLRSVVSGPLAQESKIEYSLKEHSVATVEFALDYCYGDPGKGIDSENALPLLALADELCLEPLRTGCSEALIERLVTTNAAQLQEIAARYNASVLYAAAHSITTAESNALGDLTARRLRLQRPLARNSELQTALKANTDGAAHRGRKLWGCGAGCQKGKKRSFQESEEGCMEKIGLIVSLRFPEGLGSGLQNGVLPGCSCGWAEVFWLVG